MKEKITYYFLKVFLFLLLCILGFLFWIVFNDLIGNEQEVKRVVDFVDKLI